ncbi:acetaldehyde dehydrogenase (acetylating) [Paraburkholderia pallida]|uniref:Acetaldehyde dehydrogenase n=1 Tax=Paraburkholderia pallida TaxID=2547399 RepID=A0A4P7D1A8_9BURK|nr:acetaldehyde dehydrogenase (acetylating) [Paraburkholderia pallida]QBR00957.1 acetaldehyde dehydrogenase (acetylating) [Paraburkholderia pallida]
MKDNDKLAAAIIGSGNIGTDLMIKVLRHGKHLRMGAMVGIDAASDGLARAGRLGVPVTAQGIEGLVAMPEFEDIRIAFDATSAGAHAHHAQVLRRHGVRVIDLTPAATGPFVVPVVNLFEHLDAPDINMVTCGGQATIPVVHAISRVAPVHYAEIVASIASRSAGPGTRANIDEFTQTTARALETVGGAARGKAIIVLNPAEPPLMMRDTIYCLTDEDADTGAIERSVRAMVAAVASYVPGYRLKQAVQFDRLQLDQRLFGQGKEANSPEARANGRRAGLKVSVFIEVEGSAHYLPSYAGNLDIMTSAALAAAEQIAASRVAA